MSPDRAMGPVIALGCLWSLMCFFHLTNNLVLMIPPFLVAYFGPDPWPPYGRVVVLTVVQVLLTLEPDMRMSALFPNTTIADMAAHLKRIVVFVMLGYMAAQLRAVRAVAGAVALEVDERRVAVAVGSGEAQR
jgi:hypothetical protein